MDPELSPSDNALLAAAVIEAAIKSGVGEWIVGAGARNLPLIETLMQMPEKRRGRVWNFFEERSAAFFALGRVRNSNDRVAVITTSGTAAAELLPATIEAHYSGQPLLLITADRPPEYRGSGAPQVIEQRKLLSPYVWRMVDWVNADDRRRVSDPGPIDQPEHWNVCFAEPKSGDQAGNAVGSVADPKWQRQRKEEESGATLDESFEVSYFCSDEKGGQLLILLGELSQAEQQVAEPALAKLAAPIWAEATSGLRESEKLRQLVLSNGERAIAALNPKRVLRIGGVPSLRYWRDLETLPEVDVMSVTRTKLSGLARDSQVVSAVGAITECGEGECRFENDQVSLLDEMLERFPACEPAVFRRLSECIAAEALVFLGNSLPIREWNLAASYDRAHRFCFASRGANGIDGQVSTFLGMAAEAEEIQAGAWGIFGDLTALYDLSAPWVIPQLATGTKRRIVVINNGGGRIFDRLPAVREGGKQQAEMIRNSHAHDFQHWAAMWGMGYARWDGSGEWIEPSGDAVMIEICPNDQQTTEFWNAWEDAG